MVEPKIKSKKSDSKDGYIRVCANCGKRYKETDLGLMSIAIRGHKPACNYTCNKMLGQV